MGNPYGAIRSHSTPRIDPRNFYQARVSLAGAAAKTINLGGDDAKKYKNIRLWLDAESSDVHVRINPDGTTTAATTDFPKITDSDGYPGEFVEPISYVYIYCAGTTGTLNVEAW